MKLVYFYEKHKKHILTVSIVILLILVFMPFITTRRVDIKKAYVDKEEVALYIITYHELPRNYITKYGRDYRESHNYSLDGYIIGGDTHVNTNELQSFGINSSTTLKECDIAGNGYDVNNRFTRRLVYTCNEKKVRVFYTEDHYENYTELTSFKLQLTRNVFWIIFGIYCLLFTSFYIFIFTKKRETNVPKIAKQQ